MRVTMDKSERKTRLRFAGICADAEALGVTREHLFRVLVGERQSRSLLRRYQELKRNGVNQTGPDARGRPRKTDGRAGAAPLTGPRPKAITEERAGRARRGKADATIRGGNGKTDAAGAALCQAVKEQFG